MGYPDPTNPTFEATTESYHKTLMECLRRMKQYKDKGEDPKKIGIMVASHNEDTVRFAIEKWVLLRFSSIFILAARKYVHIYVYKIIFLRFLEWKKSEFRRRIKSYVLASC